MRRMRWLAESATSRLPDASKARSYGWWKDAAVPMPLTWACVPLPARVVTAPVDLDVVVRRCTDEERSKPKLEVPEEPLQEEALRFAVNTKVRHAYNAPALRALRRVCPPSQPSSQGRVIQPASMACLDPMNSLAMPGL